MKNLNIKKKCQSHKNFKKEKKNVEQNTKRVVSIKTKAYTAK